MIVPDTPELPTRTTGSPVSIARAVACQACARASSDCENQLSFVMKTSAFAPAAAARRISAESVSSKQMATPRGRGEG